MKIAILTLPLHTNYGGILQAYALQKTLENMGHEVEILQKIPGLPHSKWLMPIVYTKRFIRRCLNKNTIPVFVEKKTAKENSVVQQYTSKFINTYLNLRYIKSLKDIQPTDYEAIVVGSDQVWRKSYFCPMWNAPIKDAFLDFTKDWNIKRFAYAASFGEDYLENYSKSEIINCSKALKKFDKISVREKSGIEICRKHLGVSSIKVLDPTMLLTDVDYIQLIYSTNTEKSNGSLMYYILDNNRYVNSFIEKISKEKSLKAFEIGVNVNDFSLKPDNRIQPPVEKWLRGFQDAELIITDSFHACVFSIIFGKSFLVIGNESRGMSRFTSLLEDYNMENHLYDLSTINENLSNNNEFLPINTKTILEEARIKSYNFLQSISK